MFLVGIFQIKTKILSLIIRQSTLFPFNQVIYQRNKYEDLFHFCYEQNNYLNWVCCLFRNCKITQRNATNEIFAFMRKSLRQITLVTLVYPSAFFLEIAIFVFFLFSLCEELKISEKKRNFLAWMQFRFSMRHHQLKMHFVFCEN